METPEGVGKSVGCIKSSRHEAGTTIDVGFPLPSSPPTTIVIPAKAGNYGNIEGVRKSEGYKQKPRRRAGIL